MSLSNDLYNMEGEFRIMNSEIEAKTAEFLKKADEIVKNQEQSIENYINHVSTNDNACGDSVKNNKLSLSYRSDSETSRSDDSQYTHRITRNNSSIIEERINYFTRIQHEGEINKNNENTQSTGPKIERENLIVNVLKAKIKALQTESLKKTEQLKKKNVENEAINKVNHRLHDDRMKLYSQINNLKAHSSKLEVKIANFSEKLQAKESECKSLFAENEALNRSAKETKQNISRVEIRLARALEDVATLTEQLTVAKISKRELTETTKKRIDELTVELERAKRKNQYAMTALSKQAQLVDNLKKQVTFLKTGREVKSVDDKLDSLLQWNV